VLLLHWLLELAVEQQLQQQQQQQDQMLLMYHWQAWI
jgi:hypothetical protein